MPLVERATVTTLLSLSVLGWHRDLDLAVLNQDYLTVPEAMIRKTESVLTLVGGRIVHATGPFARNEI